MMKKHAKRLSIILTLVLILTSFGFTGAFADVNDGVQDEAAAPDVETVDEAEPEEDAVVEEPAEDPAEEPAVEPAEDPAEEPAADPADDPEEEAVVEPVEEEDEALVEEEPVEAQAAGDTYTIKWVNNDGTVLETDKGVADGTVPTFDGATPTRAKEDGDKEDGVKYAFAGWTPSVEAAKADATYTAQYRSLNGTPKKPSVTAYPSYKSVRLKWKKVTKDVNGVQYADSVTVNYKVTPKQSKVKKQDSTKTSYVTKKNLKPFTKYTFKVKAYIEDGGNKKYSDTVTKSKYPFRSIRYRLSIKQGGTLTRHAGKGPKTYKLKAGTLDTDRFQTGRYIFEYKGSIFFVSRTRVGSARAVYNKNGDDYTPEEAEIYINDRGVKSSTSKLVFVSTFCQHAYAFKKSNGKWKCVEDWDCATGLASTPTPTGMYGMKTITKHTRQRHGINYWNHFNGNAALHGTKPNDKRVGMVISNGCVRNPDKYAKYMYTKVKLKSRVLIV